MSQNVTPNRLTKRQERAAALVAADTESDDRIAAACGLKDRQTIIRWRALPLFAARVAELRDAYAAAVRDLGISDKRNRVAAQQERWLAMQRVIAERAADQSMAAVPGGATGLLVRQVKWVRVIVDGDGEALPRSELVEEYAVDTGLLRELREHEKQAAQELGQWVNKVAPTDGDGKALPIAVVEFVAAPARPDVPDEDA